MKKILVQFAMIILLTTCGPSDRELSLTQIPITQTAEAEQSGIKQYMNCKNSIYDDAQLLYESASTCSTDDCKLVIAEQISRLGDKLSETCPVPHPCLANIQSSLRNLIYAKARYVEGPPSDWNYYEKSMIIEVLGEQVRDAYIDLVYELENSCISPLNQDDE